MGDVGAVEAWLRKQCAQYSYDLVGVLRIHGHLSWPIEADNEDALTRLLKDNGYLLPLPKEPAALANVIEVSLIDFLINRVEAIDGLVAVRGTERGYPDLELSGAYLGGGFHAVDIKVAKRKVNAKGVPGKTTQSRITLYTGNTYFLHPDIPFPGSTRPFADYASHHDVVAIYTLNKNSEARVEDLEIIVQPPWKIASKVRSSTTREYIGAVNNLEDLRRGRGAFATPDDFYTFWRTYNFRVAKTVKQQRARKQLADERVGGEEQGGA
jgi:hypothetical protein